MNQDEAEYLKYTWPQRVDKEIHLLEGLIKGITIDGKVTTDEARTLRAWCDRHAIVSDKHPLEEFRGADFEVAVAHIVGHVAYGVGVGLVVAVLGKA